MFTLSLYSLVIIVHVLAGALLIGGGVSGSVLRSMMKQARSGRELGQWLEFGRRVSQANPVFGITVLATGLYMGSTGWWTDRWFAVAATLWVADCAMALGVIKRSAQAIGMALGRARGELTADVVDLRDRHGWDLAIAGLRANNVAMLYLMFQKPGLLEALIVLALSQAVSFGVYLRNAARVAAAGPAPTTADAKQALWA